MNSGFDLDSSKSHNMHLKEYLDFKKQFETNGLTYKSNEVIHKICEEKSYPYVLLISICKLFHFNQFQIIFLCHLLNDEECVYRNDPTIFAQDIDLYDLRQIFNKMTSDGEKLQPIVSIIQNKGQLDEQFQRADQNRELDLEAYQKQDYSEDQYWDWDNVKQLYIYLLVIGYSVKFYLNENVKPYEEEVKKRYPEFFKKIFNLWVDKYSNKVLRTNPKRINMFYTLTLQNEETITDPAVETDCQYRNYNQIVQQVIKATTEHQQNHYEPQEK